MSLGASGIPTVVNTADPPSHTGAGPMLYRKAWGVPDVDGVYTTVGIVADTGVFATSDHRRDGSQAGDHRGRAR